LSSPTLGEQSRNILQELGWSDKKIDRLIENKVVQCG
jgi:crotonobetainyl-CoA:carnitine CoA-transferase CaiB-like acyl-CoA transferase